MRRLIDANVILRYLLKDHHKMSLRGIYKIGRSEVGETLIEFLDEVAIEHQDVVCAALALYSKTSLDFVDCILIARHKVLGDKIGSFDKKLNKML